MKKNQYARLYALLERSGLKGQKDNIVNGFTGGRTVSVRGMTGTEFAQMMVFLEGVSLRDDPRDRMRKKIISMAREMGWEVNGADGKRADMDKIKNWVLKYGINKKPFNSYTATELPALVSQFEKIYKDFLNRV